MVDKHESLDANFASLRLRLESLLATGRVPVVFMDLDDTMNRGFGHLIEPTVVEALRELAAAGVLLGLNTGADISWAGERILAETDRYFVFPFMLLATGRQIYAWVDSLQAYVLLPLSAASKGQAMRVLADYLNLPLDQCAFIADFPGTGDQQEGIDDSVLREPIGIIINVGGLRPPAELRCSWESTLLLHPPHREQRVGCGYEATALYLACLSQALRQGGYAQRAHDLRQELLQRVEQKLAVSGVQVRYDASAHQEHSLWTFKHPKREVPRGAPIRIQAKAQGLVHAGVTAGEASDHWQRIYDVPLRTTAPGTWEATMLDGDINAFTFVWFDQTRSGRLKWEGRNYHVRRVPAPAMSDARTRS